MKSTLGRQDNSIFSLIDLVGKRGVCRHAYSLFTQLSCFFGVGKTITLASVTELLHLSLLSVVICFGSCTLVSRYSVALDAR